MPRVRQDADLPKRDRLMSDRCANDMYEQVLQGAVRDGRDVNDTDDEEELEGYVKPTWDKKVAVEADAAAMRAEDMLQRDRKVRLEALRGKSDHQTLPPLERLAVEVEVWNGRGPNATSAPLKYKGKTHRHGSTQGADEDISSQVEDSGSGQMRITTTPSYLAGKLRDYQIEGVNWMLSLHARCVNGILADEMGLGKTFQTISLLAFVKYTLDLPGPHLVVVPKSVLGNWYREFKRWCPTMSVLKFHGPGTVRPMLVQTHLRRAEIKFDVVLTTYDMILREVNAFKKPQWHYLVVDEAHKLKNADSSSHNALNALTTRHRLLITGTPLQNNMKELWSLLTFLAPKLFDDSSVFTDGFDAKAADTDQLRHLHSVVASTMLRRIKAEVNTAIPPKREVYVSCGIAAKQREWYLKVLAREAGQINRSTGSREALLNVVMQLRKAVNHPYLFPEADETGGFVTDERIINCCGKMIVLDKLLAKLKGDVEGRHKVLLFSQMTRMLDIIEDYLIFRGYEYCRIDGSTGGMDRDMQMAEFNNKDSSKFIFLLSTRAGGLGINLQAANHVVIYDSDWNPQMDLQAQDRAHRIGQTREVRVYRFITDGTLEERIYQRALKKLYLDALIVQQGRVHSKKPKDAAGREELMSMVRFGATEIFKGKGTDVTDADIDALLSSGESKMSEMQKEVMKQQQQTLANFDFGVEENNVYDFDGLTFSSNQSRVLTIELDAPTTVEDLTVKLTPFGEVQKVSIHPDLTKAMVVFRNIASAVSAVEGCGLTCHYTSKQAQQLVVTSEMIDEAWGDGGRGKRERREVEQWEEEVERAAVAKKVPPPKLPKKPAFNWWWLAHEERIKELYQIECGNIIRNWRLQHEAGRKLGVSTGLIDAEDDVKDAEGRPSTDSEVPPLTAEQEEEKQRLWDEAFTTWSHRDFVHFIRVITDKGVARSDYVGISEAMDGSKTVEAVEAYSKAFWDRGPSRIAHFESYERKIAKVTKRREMHRREAEICLQKVRSTDGDPAEHMQLPLKPLGAFGPGFDRQLFLAAIKEDGTFDTADLKRKMLTVPELSFDVFAQSRPEDVFERRVQRIRQVVLQEAFRADKPAAAE